MLLNLKSINQLKRSHTRFSTPLRNPRSSHFDEIFLNSFPMDINKAESKDMLSSINAELPTEMLKKILGNLNYKSLLIAKKTCRLWKNIIVEFSFEKQASGKILEKVYF